MTVEQDKLALADLLAAVDEFGSASRGLIAWELGFPEKSMEPIWHRAVEQRMLRATGATDLGEPTYELTLAGRARLHDLRNQSVRHHRHD